MKRFFLLISMSFFVGTSSYANLNLVQASVECWAWSMGGTAPNAIVFIGTVQENKARCMKDLRNKLDLACRDIYDSSLDKPSFQLTDADVSKVTTGACLGLCIGVTYSAAGTCK